MLTYGGVSLFVVVFAMYPLAIALFREANISRKLIPGAIALGSFTFTMTALPGTPQIQNLIPREHFGTDAMAAPILGIAAALVMGLGGYIYLKWKEGRLTAAGDLFTEPKQGVKEINVASLPHPLLAFLPLFAVVGTLNLAKWPIIPALLSGILLTIALKPSVINNLVSVFNAGANGSIIAIINTSAAVGFGMVVRAVPAFKQLTDFVMGIEGNPSFHLPSLLTFSPAQPVRPQVASALPLLRSVKNTLLLLKQQALTPRFSTASPLSHPAVSIPCRIMAQS